MRKDRETDGVQSQCSSEEPLQTFGGALEHLKNNKRVARKDWGDAGVFVYLQRGGAYFSKRDNGKPVNGVSTRLFDKIPKEAETYLPMLCIMVRDTLHPGWVPPQCDMLAEDWYVVY